MEMPNHLSCALSAAVCEGKKKALDNARCWKMHLPTLNAIILAATSKELSCWQLPYKAQQWKGPIRAQ